MEVLALGMTSAIYLLERASQNKWHHQAGKLCGYIDDTSQDSQEVKAWSQIGLPNGQ